MRPNNIKQSNIHIIGISENESRNRKKKFEEEVWKFNELYENHKPRRSSLSLQQKKASPHVRHNLINLLKTSIRVKAETMLHLEKQVRVGFLKQYILHFLPSSRVS